MGLIRQISFVLAVTILCLWPTWSFAQSAEMKEAINKYKELDAHGRYGDAEPFAKRALELAEKEFGPNHEHTAV